MYNVSSLSIIVVGVKSLNINKQEPHWPRRGVKFSRRYQKFWRIGFRLIRVSVRVFANSRLLDQKFPASRTRRATPVVAVVDVVAVVVRLTAQLRPVSGFLASVLVGEVRVRDVDRWRTKFRLPWIAAFDRVVIVRFWGRACRCRRVRLLVPLFVRRVVADFVVDVDDDFVVTVRGWKILKNILSFNYLHVTICSFLLSTEPYCNLFKWKWKIVRDSWSRSHEFESQYQNVHI